ncbi:MAG TPA: FAD:protein FMN transferase [Vicinamibacterales bacterium]|nr:FAD:protein FMN transferase [Vicinamibacterales bacterium]HOQ59300.1 FAD:protein FMN transferase [Vicinamibacterales bacterium]HPK71731.1 FAD:protein FMN transferase [Vicinamibacterales bacterium]
MRVPLPAGRTLLAVAVLAMAGFGLGRAIRQEADPAADLQVRTRLLMGTVVEIKVPASDGRIDERAVQAALDEMSRVERVFSPSKPGGGPLTPEERSEVEAVIEAGRRLAAETDGAFDLRIRDWIDLWGFESDPRVPGETEMQRVAAARRRRDPEGPLTEFTFGAVAKGYAVDRAVAVLESRGVTRALVNAGGEVGAIGDGWTVGVRHPRDPGALLERVRLAEGRAIATSGDYENFFVADGRRYHHLLVPATGLPATGARSVSVMAPRCAEADAWATALFVLGPERALAAAARHPELDVMIVDADGRVTRSARWNAGVPEGRP